MVEGIFVPFDFWVSTYTYVCICMLHKCQIISFFTKFFSGKLRNHILNSWRAMTKGQNLPELPIEDDMFNKKVSFFEATSESVVQFTVGDIIIRTYGVSDDLTTKFFQLFSLASSMFSLVIAFIFVSFVCF